MIVAAGILQNTTTGRYHPILFRDAPFPGGVLTPRRLKSYGHHTEGFTSHEEAHASLDDDRLAGAVIDPTVIPWDGEDVPAMIGYLKQGRLVFI